MAEDEIGLASRDAQMKAEKELIREIETARHSGETVFFSVPVGQEKYVSKAVRNMMHSVSSNKPEKAEKKCPLESPTDAWFCPHCSWYNEFEWDACDHCGYVVVDKVWVFALDFEETPPKDEQSTVRKPEGVEELLEMENLPPSYKILLTLVKKEG